MSLQAKRFKQLIVEVRGIQKHGPISDILFLSLLTRPLIIKTAGM